jgi:ASC-1-like (ASCH) protein
VDAKMKHEMHLHSEPFEKVKLGTKKVEGRILDKKRQKIKVGDEIVFEDRETGNTMSVIVTNLEKFENFSQMFDKTNKTDWGITMDYKKEKFIDAMGNYYSQDEENKLGVVAIHFKLK